MRTWEKERHAVAHFPMNWPLREEKAMGSVRSAPRPSLARGGGRACLRMALSAHACCLTSVAIAQVLRCRLVDDELPGRLAAAGVLLAMMRSCLGVDGGAADVVAGASQVLAALCLHHVARLDVCIRAPSSCLCHVVVRDRFGGSEQLRPVLVWVERSDTISKRLRMILHVLATHSNTSLVQPAITGPEPTTQRSVVETQYWGTQLSFCLT